MGRCYLMLHLLFSLAVLTIGKRILLLPMNFPSHVSQFVTIGDSLVDRGHEVHLLTSVTNPLVSRLQQGKLKVILHEAAIPDFFSGLTDEERNKILETFMEITELESFRKIPPGWKGVCENPILDENVFKLLKNNGYDLIIVDTFVINRCSLVLVYKLQVPFIALTTQYEPWLLRNPSLPSVSPFSSEVAFSEKMTFWERLYNLWTVLDWTIAPRSAYIDLELVRKYAPEMKLVSQNDIATKAQLWFIDTDFVLDYPRPVMANEILIGGLTTKPSQPLPPELETFISSNPHGLLLLSFGTFPAALPGNALNKLWKVLKQVNYNVIWKYPYDPPKDIPRNIYVAKWLPQNDILGHHLTKVFITHSGANGQFEALYHGVPMINFPLFAEQPYNAKRSEYHGFSITLDIHTFSVEELQLAINTVIKNQTYKENIMKASKVYKGQNMTPKERVVYWVEYVLKYGADHLRSYALDMPWYEYLMLDILGAVLLFCLITSCLLLTLFIFLWRRCCKPKLKSE